ncbi:hypothetical protein HU200_051672 [Digitaria exilis]|uniref:KIB1-4 beta-propeller domain-containing protein n=1 Tax=Digitaria exilis TaxID=1010633 RepID=A0A835AML6_9POAL|nr:hypothetical protein HU200_051672 [Digitaria exilis]
MELRALPSSTRRKTTLRQLPKSRSIVSLSFRVRFEVGAIVIGSNGEAHKVPVVRGHRPSRGSKAKRSCAVTKPPLPSALAIATTSSWPAKRARGPRRARLPIGGRSWAALDYGLAGVIAERALADDVSSYMSFRVVCREWRRGTEDVPGQPLGCLLDRRFHPRRWIMLREEAPPGPAGRHRRRFLNVSTGQCVQTELPELDGHHLLGATSEGLLALVDVSTHVVRVLNPVTRQLAAELPSLSSADPLLFPRIRRIADGFEVRGIGLADDSTVAFCLGCDLLVARPGDDGWASVKAPEYGWRVLSATSFSGRVYCATNYRAVMALESGSDNQWRLEVVAEIPFIVNPRTLDAVHLFGNDGELLLLRSWLPPRRPGDDGKCTRRYQVYRVDLDAHKVVYVRGLRGRAVFVGKVRALSVSAAAFPSIRSNTVYLGYDLAERMQYGAAAYNLHDRRITELGNKKGEGWAWTRPCGIGEYLPWYVSGECGGMEEI